MTEVLGKSEFEVACTIKGVDLLVPDETNFEAAKFILLQSGNVMLRSKARDSKSPDLDPYFTSVVV